MRESVVRGRQEGGVSIFSFQSTISFHRGGSSFSRVKTPKKIAQYFQRQRIAIYTLHAFTNTRNSLRKIKFIETEWSDFHTIAVKELACIFFIFSHSVFVRPRIALGSFFVSFHLVFSTSCTDTGRRGIILKFFCYFIL